MENKNTKLVIILVLIVAIVGLTLGFATFSNQLKISANATVSPDANDFKINVYVLKDNLNRNTYQGYWHTYVVNTENYVLSNTTSTAGVVYSGRGATNDLATMNITNSGGDFSASINLKIPEPDLTFDFMLMIKNEGLYDAYLDITSLFDLGYICIAEEGTRQDLVDTSCENIDYWVSPYTGIDVDNNWVDLEFDDSGIVKIEIDQTVFLRIGIENISTAADGNFTIDFDDIIFNFTTAI